MKHLPLLLLAVAPLFAQENTFSTTTAPPIITVEPPWHCYMTTSAGEQIKLPMHDGERTLQGCLWQFEIHFTRKGAADVLGELQKFIQADKTITREEILRLIATTKAIAEGKPSTAAKELQLRTRDGQVVATIR